MGVSSDIVKHGLRPFEGPLAIDHPLFFIHVTNQRVESLCCVDEFLLGDGVCIVEWADKAAELFPTDSCWIGLEYSLECGHRESRRTLTLTTASTRFEPLLKSLAAAFPLAARCWAAGGLQPPSALS